MEIDPPDPAKETINRGKHGISLWDAALMDFTTAMVALDTRFAYSEDRYRAWGSIDGVLHVLAFTMRGQKMRPISLRQANWMEVRRYGKS
jgi:uncharacterized DUF497 family protein